jgi:hypothetical protein
MTNNLELLVNPVHCCGNVKTADYTRIPIAGKGAVRVQAKLPSGKSSKIVFEDVLYVPGLAGVNLLSWGVINRKGFEMSTEGDNIFIRNGSSTGRIVCWAKWEGSDYILQQMEDDSAQRLASYRQWHEAFGHVSPASIKPSCYEDGNLIPPTPKNFECDVCITSKSTKRTPAATTSRASRILKSIHSDLSGKFSVASMGKSLYYISFIDDYSRYAWITFLKNKSDAAKAIKDFVHLRKHQDPEHPILRFRTDNGGEYVNENLKEFFTSEGIIHELTPAYSHESNGVAERFNRTIITMARGMLHGLPRSLWSEATNTAVYLKNRIPHKAVKDQTPYEAIHGKLPTIHHLQPFGRKCYVHIPEERRPPGSKLLPRALEGKFIGYTTSDKIFRIYIPSQQRVIETWQVKFPRHNLGEVSTPKDDDEQNTTTDEHTTIQLPIIPPPAPQQQPEGIEQQQQQEEPAAEFEVQAPPPPPNPDEYEHISPTPSPPPEHRELRTRAGRVIRLPEYYGRTAIEEVARLLGMHELKTYRQALKGQDCMKWRQAMDEELAALRRNNTFTVVPRPAGKKIVGSKWVYKIKRLADGSVERYKARGVAQGFSQIPGEDFDEIFAPVLRYESLRLLLALTAHFGWKPRQFDVKSAFLYGELTEDVYMHPLPGYEEGDLVWLLKKCLYGLKQSAREWYAVLSTYLLENGFQASNFDPCVFVHHEREMFLSIYVDDLVLFAAPTTNVEAFVEKLSTHFELTELGLAEWILGMQITYSDEGISLSQHAYINKILKRFGMESSRPVSTPLAIGTKLRKGTPEQQLEDPTHYQAIIGSIMYAVTGTRPDLAHTITLLSQFNSCPNQSHLTAVKHTLRYLNGTKDWTLNFPSGKPLVLNGYADADYAACLDTRRSISGYIFRLGEATICWKSRKQASVSTSTTEAEYVALSLASRQVQWLHKAFQDFQLTVPCALHCDNTGAIDITQDDKVNDRTKHIDIHYHKVREEFRKGTFELLQVASADNLADVCTKTLPKPTHEKLSTIIQNHRDIST